MCAHYANSFIKDLWIVKHIYSTLQTGNSFRIKMKVKVTQSCPIHCNSMHFTVQCMEFHTVQCMEIFKPKQWSGFPSPWDLPNPVIKPRSLALQVDSLPAEPQGKPRYLNLITTSHTGTSYLLAVCFLESWHNYMFLSILTVRALLSEVQTLASIPHSGF